MSDEEEESMSEGFSASEDEWKPTKDVRGGESSDDDDSDFEESPQALGEQNYGTGAATRRKGAPPKSAVVKQTAIKKRKGAGQSLRTKLYNKYRPPPKTFPSPNSAGSNSPSASTSRTASKNVKMPNESGEHGNDSSSESSVDDYLVNPDDIDFQSSFFNVRSSEGKTKSVSAPPPVFDCNIGIGKLSDSGSEDNNESSTEEQGNGKSFDFANLLDNVNSLERAKETIAKRAVAAAAKELQELKTSGRSGNKGNTTAMDVNTLLALGETKESLAAMRSVKSKDDGEEEDDDRDKIEVGPQRLSKTKSTRVKRHTKTRPASTVVAGDTDDSDFEEVAEDTGSVSHSTTYDTSALLNTTEGLEIHVELPSKQRRNKDKKKQDLEMVLKRKLNRDLKERFLHLHKTSLLCCFARSYRYNRMLNDTPLMQAALKLLPSSNAYPPERGTEIKYFQSMVTWYKTAVKLASPNLYGEKVRKSRRRVKRELLEQIRRKEASCKQDFAFIFVVLLRAMGLQCRLIVNMQPLPLRPAQSDLLTVKMKRNASEIKAEVEKIELEAKKLKIEGVKMEKSDGERTEKVGSRREDKKREKDNEKVSSKKEEEGRKKEKKAEEVLTDSKKEMETKQSHTEQKEVAKNAHKERKRAPSAKLADMIASQKEVNTATVAKKAKTYEKEIPQRSSKRMQAREGVNREEEAKEINAKQQLANEEKETKTTKTTKESLDAKGTVEGKEEANNSQSPKDTAVHKNAPTKKPTLARLRSKRGATESETHKLDLLADKPCLSLSEATPVARRTRKASTEKQATNKAITTIANSAKPTIQVGSPVLPKIVIQSGKTVHTAQPKERENRPNTATRLNTRATRSRSKSPKAHISPTFLQSTNYKNKFPEQNSTLKPKSTRTNSKSPTQKICISTEFLKTQNATATKAIASGTRSGRILRSCQNANEEKVVGVSKIPQLDGADDSLDKQKRPQLKKLKKKKSNAHDESDEDFEPSPPKQPKKAPNSTVKDKLKIDKRVLSSDEESSIGAVKRNPTAADIWVEVWSDAEEQWICIELFKGKLHSVEAIRKAASSNFAYVFAFQNDLSIKDVTARYCPNWTTTIRKSRVERAWLEAAFTPYYGQRTQRDIREDQELRRIHEEKPMPTAIGDYKDHPLYALERHLLKFQAIYPPNPPTLGFVRGEAVYARECVHTLHSRDIWLKQARTVKLGEQPYKIVKARPKWDRLTQTVIKDQPLEIFGYWQTEDYEPPTAENGIVPRNAYGNVELFKECMLPKKTVHLRLTGLNRICKKLGIDCAQAVTGFDFHQGACHPLYDGFVVCEEFGDQVTAAWYQDQEELEKKEQDKYEARVYGNWKKLIKGLLIRERLKKKYNF